MIKDKDVQKETLKKKVIKKYRVLVKWYADFKKPSLSVMVFGAVIVVVSMSLVCSIYRVASLMQEIAPFRSGQSVITYDNRTFVRHDEPPIAMTIVTDTQCVTCDGALREIREQLDRYVPTAFVVETVDLATDEGVRYGRKHNISVAPAVVFDALVMQTNFYQKAEQFFRKTSHEDSGVTFYPYGMTNVVPERYIDTPAVEQGTSVGSEDALVTVHVFMSADCVLCATQNGVLNLLRIKYDEKLRIVYHFSRQTEQANRMTAALVCSEGQNQFIPYLKRVFARVAAWRSIENIDNVLVAYARFVGQVDEEQFSACLLHEDTRTAIDAQDKLFDQFGVASVPTLFIGTQRFDGVQTYKTLTTQIDALLSQKD